MKTNKKVAAIGTTVTTTTGHTGSNVWVDEMFGGYPTKLQSDPKFKELTVGARNLGALIGRYVPPGKGQQEALQNLVSSFRGAANEIANAISLPSSI